MPITLDQLEKVNKERKKRGLQPLTMQNVKRAHAEAGSPKTDENFAMDFLIGYSTGIPWPTTGGITGAMMHQATQPRFDSVNPPISEMPQRAAEPVQQSDPAPAADYSSPSSDFGSGNAGFE